MFGKKPTKSILKIDTGNTYKYQNVPPPFPEVTFSFLYLNALKLLGVKEKVSQKDPCSECEDIKKCGGRPQNSRLLPRSASYGLSEYEKASGLKQSHKGLVVNEVGVYLHRGTSGDACKLIQLLQIYEGRYLRFGYYIRNPKTGSWAWGQNPLTLTFNDLAKLLTRAVDKGILPSRFRPKH